MKKLSIFLDLDGVIFNCSKGFANKFNLQLPKMSYLEYGHHEKHWTEENRALLDHDYWLNLDFYPWSKNIIQIVEKYDSNFKFLTACIRNEGCYSGKYAAIKNKLGGEYPNKLITCYRDKTFAAAGKNCLLIDDKESNCVDWIKAGGTAYQWKERTEDMTEKSLRELVDLEYFIQYNS